MLRRLLIRSGDCWALADNSRGRPHPFGWDRLEQPPRTEAQKRRDMEIVAAMLGTLGKGYRR